MTDNPLPIANRNLSESEYKSLCKQIRQYQLANGSKKKKSKPILKPIGQTVSVEKKLLVQQSPVDWDAVENGCPFALDPQATLLYTKAGNSRALCLNTMSTIPVGGASVYRVFL